MKNKTIALIGAGSTGVQILPQIQPVAKRVDHYFSGKTWILPIGFGSDELQLRGAVGNCKWFKLIQAVICCTHMVFTVKHDKEELEKWAKDPSLYHAWRHKIEKTVNGAALITIFGTSLQKEFQSINQAAMKKKLEKKPEIMEAMEPAWPPGCRRLTPGPGYLEL